MVRRRALVAVAGLAFAGLVVGGCGGAAHTSTDPANSSVSVAGATGRPADTGPAATGTSTPARTTAAPATTASPTAASPTAASPNTASPATTPPATTAPATTTALLAPPYPLTATTVALVDTSRPTVAYGREISASRALTTLVWAPAVTGRWPLVVFAHGYQVGPTPYIGLLEHWASEGFVVAAPEFPLTDQAVAGANLDEDDMVNQPADVRFVTDALVAPGSPLAARIDPTRVAVAGHSDGSETALAASIAPTPPGEPRYRAVIAMSCQPVTTGTSANPPILVTQGDADTINPPSNGYATYAQASSPKYLEVLHGAEHLPPLEVGTVWYPTLSGVTTAFLDDYVAGDGTQQAIFAAGNQPPYGSIQSG